MWLIGNYIERWMDEGRPFDEGLAFDIYRRSMDFELKMFTEASDTHTTEPES